MKKRLFMAVAVGAIGMFAVANYCNNVADSTNDLLVANVEALADNESGGGDKTCTYNKVSKDEEKHELKCTVKEVNVVNWTKLIVNVFAVSL